MSYMKWNPPSGESQVKKTLVIRRSWKHSWTLHYNEFIHENNISLLQYYDDIHLLQFIKKYSSLRKTPSETASLLLRAIPIFFLSSRGQLSTCKRDTAVQKLLHPKNRPPLSIYSTHGSVTTLIHYIFHLWVIHMLFRSQVLRHLTLLNFAASHSWTISSGTLSPYFRRRKEKSKFWKWSKKKRSTPVL